MKSSWRWFGDQDSVSIQEVQQTGVSDVVSSLHHLPCGSLWTVDAIQEHQRKIKKGSGDSSLNSMNWSIVESLPVHESIKQQRGDYRQHIRNYQDSLRNLGRCGIQLVVYNFMPVLDWTRTHLRAPFRGTKTLFFSERDFIGYDLFALQRPDAHHDYTQEQIQIAQLHWNSLNEVQRLEIEQSIFTGLPGTVEDFQREDFLHCLSQYQGMTESSYTQRLIDFLSEVIPVAEEAGVYMALHPDDPPKTLFGLPRITHRREHFQNLLQKVNSPHNGLTFCTGSLGALGDPQIVDWLEEFAARTYFLHLRNVEFENNSKCDFSERGHLQGFIPMMDILIAALREELRRKIQGHPFPELYYRSDHGVLYDFDARVDAYPGYWPVGRLVGLSELRGAIQALKYLSPKNGAK